MPKPARYALLYLFVALVVSAGLWAFNNVDWQAVLDAAAMP